MSYKKVTIASVILKPNKKQHLSGRSSGGRILFIKYRVSQNKHTHLMSHKKVTITAVIFKPNKKQRLSGRSSGGRILFYKVPGEPK